MSLIQSIGQLADHQVNLCRDVVLPKIALAEQRRHTLADLFGRELV